MPRAGRRCGQSFGHHHPVEDQGAAVLRADPMMARHSHVSKIDPPRAPAPGPKEPVNVFDLHTGSSVHEKGGDGLMGRGVRCGLGIDEEIVGSFRPHHKTFLAVQDIIVSVSSGNRGRPEEIRAALAVLSGLRRSRAFLQGWASETFLFVHPYRKGESLLPRYSQANKGRKGWSRARRSLPGPPLPRSTWLPGLPT